MKKEVKVKLQFLHSDFTLKSFTKWEETLFFFHIFIKFSPRRKKINTRPPSKDIKFKKKPTILNSSFQNKKINAQTFFFLLLLSSVTSENFFGICRLWSHWHKFATLSFNSNFRYIYSPRRTWWNLGFGIVTKEQNGALDSQIFY